MGGNYEKGIYNHLMEVMARLEAVESSLCTEKSEHKDDVRRLDARLNELTRENQLLRDDNARLKSILHTTAPTPPSHLPGTRRAESLPMPIMAGRRQAAGRAARKAIKEPRLPRRKRKKE